MLNYKKVNSKKSKIEKHECKFKKFSHLMQKKIVKNIKSRKYSLSNEIEICLQSFLGVNIKKLKFLVFNKLFAN